MLRRDFLTRSGLAVAGALTANSLEVLAAPKKLIDPFGVQLFSVRSLLPDDPKGVMTKLAQMGYKQFESFQGPKGFLWGMEPKEIKTFLDGLGVKMVSTHFDFKGAAANPDTLKQYIDMAQGAGLKYLICPWIGAQKTWDEWKIVADSFNKVGEQVTKSGLKFGYHNHDYSFRPLDGKLPQDYLLQNTDPKNVMFELDLCWIDVTGVSTADHLKKYGKRYELCHVKDYTKENGKPVQNDLGKGNVDFKKTLRLAMDSGIKYFLVEQEEYPESPLVSLANDAQYMKKLSV
nr:sugar phosphate isomerase/epimerase [uncultured Dyadobacter sp.]